MCIIKSWTTGDVFKGAFARKMMEKYPGDWDVLSGPSVSKKKIK